jgi:hypothetical protein
MQKKGALSIHSLAALAIVALFLLVLMVGFSAPPSPTGAITSVVSSCIDEGVVEEEVTVKLRDGVYRTYTQTVRDLDAVYECRRDNWPGKFDRKPDVYGSEYAYVYSSRRVGDKMMVQGEFIPDAVGNERPSRHNLI